MLEISRKWGKSWFLLALLAEECERHPGERMVYGAPTYVQLREFAFPIMRELEALAPPDCRPRFHEASGHWRFPNGSWVHLFACDDLNAAERGRGPKARRAVFDEAGAVPGPVLSYVVKEVFRPSLMLCEEPLTILSGTPSREPQHPFEDAAVIAESTGARFHRTIYDNPMLTPARIEQIIAENARDDGMSVEDYKKSPGFRREYLAERAVDPTLVVVPEWDGKRAALLQPVQRPDYFNGMTVLDFGGADPHAATFGYWHFQRAAWVVEDEVLLREGENTGKLTAALKAKERELWGVAKWDGSLRAGLEDPRETLTDNVPDWMRDILVKEAPEQPFARWADNDLQLVRDLYELHLMAFIPTSKDNLELQVNNLRELLRLNQLVLHPRCVNTDRHLRTTTWANHKRRDFKRTAAGEHGDLVATLIYGGRNLDRRNPAPGYLSEPVNATVGVRVRHREASKDFGTELLESSPLGRRLLGQRARRIR